MTKSFFIFTVLQKLSIVAQPGGQKLDCINLRKSNCIHIGKANIPAELIWKELIWKELKSDPYVMIENVRIELQSRVLF